MTEHDPESHEPVALVERLVRDDVDRKRFLKLAGQRARPPASARS